jgi:hypothetical protein
MLTENSGDTVEFVAKFLEIEEYTSEVLTNQMVNIFRS